jgi:hypothetical protein
VAHGMTNILTFAWGPYSDFGIPKETKAWEKKDAPPMWMLVDLDGKKLPAYFTNQRSVEEIHRFHKQFDALSLRRTPTDIALYLSNDTAELASLETANHVWESIWARTRNVLCYLLRMKGVTADYVDDETLPTTTEHFTTIIVPASYSLSQEAAGKLAQFAKEGGTLILAGPSGLVDPWLAKYPNLGGPAWAELDWKAPQFQVETANVCFLGGKSKMQVPSDESNAFKGVNFGAMPKAKSITDANGEIVGWQRPWGKGKVVAYGIFPETCCSNPHPAMNHLRWLSQMAKLANVRYSGRWNAGNAVPAKGKLGEGSPVVEVVVRVRKEHEADEKFVFVLNHGGAGTGVVEIPVDEARWEAADALTGEPMPQTSSSSRVWRVRLTVKPWEYKIIHLKKAA